MKFRHLSLKDICTIDVGYPFKSELFNTKSEGTRLIRGKNVTRRSIRWGGDTRWWSEDLFEDKMPQLAIFDIVIGMDGSLVGKNYAMIRKTDIPSLLVQRVARLRANPGFNQKYLYYLIANNKFEEYIEHIKTGSTIPHISVKQLYDFKVEVPNKIYQDRIAEIISSIDDKIELNGRINKNLEEIAQTLYKRWFVDFEFPNENGEPYKSSGGEMVDSELGMIPQGWEVKEINLVIKNKKERVGLKIMPVLSAVKEGKLVLSSDFFTKNVPSSNISKYLIVSPREFSYNPARINIGSIGMNEFDFNGCVSPIYVVLKPDYIYVNFFSLYFKTSTFSDEVSLRASGSVRQSLNFDELGRIKIVYPSKDSVIKFNEIYDSIYFGVKSNEKQIANLSKIRDELLPKLMSGEIEVPIEE